MWTNQQYPADLVTFTKENLNGKFYFLCSEFVLVKNRKMFASTDSDTKSIAQKMKFSHLRKKFSMENFIFCAVYKVTKTKKCLKTGKTIMKIISQFCITTVTIIDRSLSYLNPYSFNTSFVSIITQVVNFMSPHYDVEFLITFIAKNYANIIDAFIWIHMKDFRIINTIISLIS